MSDESTTTTETTAAPVAAETAAAEPVAFSSDPATEAAAFAELRGKRNAAANARAKSAAETVAPAVPAAPAAKPEGQSLQEKLQTKAEQPETEKPRDQNKPPSNLNGQRKKFFDAINAQKVADESAKQVQTVEQKAAEMAAKLEEAQGFQARYRSLMSEGKFDEALRLSGVDGLDSVEALQRRVLEQEGLIKSTPKDDPLTRELKDQLAELKQWRDERVQAEKRASEEAREQSANRELFGAVVENNTTHENPVIQSWAKVPGFNQQVFAAMKAYPNATEDQIYTQVLSGFTQLADALVEAGIVVRPGAPAAKIPAQASAKPEASRAGTSDKPQRRVASISTQSAEPATPGPWDPSKDREAWDSLTQRRRHG
jgi:hypothetical protein